MGENEVVTPKPESVFVKLLNGKTDEVFTVLCLTAVAIVSIVMLGEAGKEIAIAIGGGIVGYLKKSN